MVALQPRGERWDRNSETAKAGMHVLLIEGLTDARETLSELLEALGYRVTAVAGAAEARRVTAIPAAIISDLSFNDGAAFSLIDELRGQAGWGRVRVVVLTAYDDPENRQRAENAGFDTFLVKPVSIWVLHRALQELALA